METVHEFLRTLASKGVKLSVEAGQLNCYAQKGVLTPDLRDGIVRYKSAIIALFENLQGRAAAAAETTRAGEAVEFPLSSGQQGLYILQKLHPGMSAYNVPLCFRIHSEIDPPLLAQAWDRVQEQFPILTARVIERDGALVQRLDDACRTTLRQRVIDVAGEDVLPFLRQEAKRPFDLNAGPLTRVELFVPKDEKPILLLTVHHIIVDGTSALLVLKSLLTFYQQLRDGKTVRPAPAQHGYRDFVAWEEEMLVSAEGAAHARYWQQQLAGDLPVFELLPDVPRQLAPGAGGQTLVEHLPEDLSQWVREFARAQSLPPSVLFLALFQLLLHRHSNQDDIVVGMPVMGRVAGKYAAEVGYFVNMIPLRTRFGARLELADFLRKVQATMLDGLYHSSYPFPLMVDAIKARSAERNPVFQVSYAYQNFIKPAEFAALLQQDAIEIENVPGIFQEGESELGLEVYEDPASFHVHLKFDPGVYGEDTVRRLFQRYCGLLRGVRENPGRFIDEYSILTEDETHKLLVAFNDTAADYPKDKCVHELIGEQVARLPEKTAIVCGDAQLTYGELAARSHDLALYLQSRGVGPDAVVGLCMERSLEMMAGLVGILQAGGAYVPLDPGYPDDRLAYMLEDSGVTVVLTQDRLRDRLDALIGGDVEVLALDRQWPEIAERVAELKANNVRLAQAVKPHHLAYVIYTSGSTGRPKGVMVEHRSVVNYLTYCARNYVTPGDNLFASFLHFPLTFDASVTSLFVPLVVGKAIDANPDGGIETFRDGAFLDRGYDFVKLTPAHLLLLRGNAADVPDAYFAKKNLLVLGGEALTRDHVDFLARRNADVEVVNEYGPTEATVGCTTSRIAVRDLRDAALRSGENITIGAPISNTRIYVLDRHRNPQPIGVPGELYIAGDGLARGYLNRPELTEERFVPDPFVPGTRMYKSGDLARWMDDGTLQYLGRIDTQVKIRGYRIEPGEIEAQLNQHPDVQDSAVIARGEGGDKQLVAFYRAKATTGADDVVQLAAGELRAHLSRSLPDYMVPAAYVSVAAIPLDPNGKVDRRALARIDVALGSTRGHVAPRNDLERRLTAIWADVLKRAPETIGVEDNFFELGGHSLLATQVISRMRMELGVELPLKTIFERTTIAELAMLLNRADATDVSRIRPIDRAAFDRLPLSFAQERLWFIDQLDPDSAGYNVPGAVTIDGSLDVDRLERAFNVVIERHESLRTVFPSEDGRPYQRVLAHLDFALERIDLRHHGEEEREAKAREICQADAATPFDLVHGPLLRGKAIRLADDRHLLMLNMHHIVSDGWSLGILIREVGAVLDALRDERAPELPPLPVQYADYSVWQRQWLEEGGVLARQLAYWQEKLAGVPESLDLATDYPRPATRTFAGAAHEFALDSALTARLRALAEREGGTLYMVLVAAFKALLHRYTGQSDICVGSPIANRQYAETEGLIGMFVNTLALRSTVTGNEPFHALLAKVKATCLEAYEHQDAPFEKVVDLVRPQRNMAITPLFQVMVILQNAVPVSPDPAIQRYALGSGISKFDLTLELTEEGDGLAGSIEYSTALFRQQTIERMAEHFAALCRAIVAGPATLVRDLDFLPATEEQRVVVEYNDTRADYPKDVRIHDLFVDQVERAPDRIAVSFDGRALTYRQLHERSRELALYLQAHGIGADSIVGLCLERSLEMMVAIMGTVMAGGAYMPLDPTYPDDRLTYMLQDSATTVVLTQRKFADRVHALTGGVAQVVALDAEWDRIREGGAAELRREAGPRNLCYVIYTSGSTGKPKGVLTEHRALVNRLVWMQNSYLLTESDVVLQKTPYSFDVSVWEFFWPMIAGASVVFAAPEGHKDVAYLEDLINEAGVTTLHYVPSMLYTFLEHARGECPTVRQVFCSGEALDRKAVDHYGTRFPSAQLHNLYGPTEAAIDVTSYDCTRLTYPFVPIGAPIANTQIYILDAYGNPQPIGVPGELHIAGDGLARGYLNRPELTREKFVDNPFIPGARMYKSGDLARWMDDGNIQYLGRIDTQVKIRGFRIELGEIEARLNQHPAIQDSAVVPKGQGAEKHLVAFYRAKESAPGRIVRVPYEELTAFIAAALPEYMVPAAFVSLAAIPLNANGKADRGALARIDVAVESSRAYVAPRNETEKRLVEIWAAVLKLDPQKIGVDDNFFELGGHSLLATQLVSRIRAAFETDLPLKSIFEGGTVAQLAHSIQRSANSAVPVIRPVDRATLDRLPLSFAQERLWFIDQLEPGSAGYNVPGAVVLTGELDVDRLEQALNLIVERHESLRTVFPSEEGRPQQRVLDRLELRLQRIDLTQEDRGTRDAKARELCRREATTPFDLAAGPLLRGMVIRLAGDEHVLMLTMHHIISDGWSLGVLIREMGAIMDALREGRPPELPPLPIQYADYSVWQRRWLEEGGVLARQLSYWQEKLAGVPESLELPTDHARPAMQSFAGATHAFAVDAELTNALRSLAEREGGTLYMVLLAAFKALLHRYTGQSDICIGAPIANRQYGETEGLIGMFVNTLALRSRIEGDDPFLGVLAKVRDTCLEAYEHQDAPFERVVDLVRPHRNLAMSPVFQVMVLLQNVDMGMSEASVRPYPVDNGISKFDLTVAFSETADGLSAAIEYSTALFEGSTIARMAAHFTALCRAVTAMPAARVRDLDFLAAVEKQRLVVDYNATEADYPRDRCFQHLFRDQVARHAEAIAATCRDEHLTYQQLHDRSVELALVLQSQGVGPDRLVGLCMERSLDMIVGLLGILQAGGAYVPLDPAYPDERLRYMLEDSAVPIVLTQERLRGRLASLNAGADVVALDAQWPEIRDRAAALRAQNVQLEERTEPHHLAYAIYTSGSTGRPKGVMVEHRNLVNYLTYCLRHYIGGGDGRYASFIHFPLTFDASITSLFVPLLAGKGIDVSDGDPLEIFKAGEFLDRGYDFIKLTPAHLLLLRSNSAALPEAYFRRRNLLVVGGEALTHDHVDFLAVPDCGIEIVNEYGPTETTVGCTTSRFAPRASGEAITIGAPIANTQIYILDAYGNVQPTGVPGELHIGGDSVARGYLNRPELTREKFVDNPFRPGTRMYKTGDLARWREDGTLEYLGRIDTQVKIRGFRIEPGEIEARLNQHPAIQDSAVVAQGRDANRRLVAFYHAKETTGDGIVQVPAEELRAHVAAALPEYMVPFSFVSLAAIPLNPNGKVDRGALERMNVAAAAGREYVAPRNDTERRLAAIWAAVLNREPDSIGVEDDFFELGGHSLAAVQLMAKTNREFGRSLPLSTLFTAPTVAAMACSISGGESAAFDILVPIRSTGEGRPVFAIPGAGGNVLSLRALAQSLGERQPLFALQAVGLDGSTPPLSSVEETARANVAAVKRVQPRGPYSLIGHSYGGVVAYEMARMLLEEGEEVASLVLLDSIAPSVVQSKPSADEADELFDACTTLAALYGQELPVDGERLRRSTREENVRYIAGLLRERGLDITDEQFAAFYGVSRANLACYRHYKPAMLPANIDVSLHRAMRRPHNEAPLPPDYGWNELLRDPIRVHDVDADHFSIVEKAVLHEAAQTV